MNDFNARLEQRLDELRQRPELLMRYDVTGDGELDEQEWELVRRMIAVELRTAEERGAQWALDVEPQVLRDRYEVVGLLGRGGQAYTHLARDLEDDGRHVVVKELRIHVARDWKSIELFERESEILEQLTHPRIPRYVDSFHLEDDDDVRFMLVQDYVDGHDLEHFVQNGGRWDESEAFARLAEVGEILEYLHGRSPPVLHRDIKPSNLIIGRDAALYVVDFGAVQTVVSDTVGGSTIIGTSGYVPMEQYMGRAQPASDIYALGATTVHLMTGTHPADLPFVRGRLDHRSRLTASPGFVDLLEQMLSPVVEDRPANATELLARLDDLSGAARTDAPEPVGQTNPSTAMELSPHSPLPVLPDSPSDRWLATTGNGQSLIHIDRTRPWLKVTRQGNQLTRTISVDEGNRGLRIIATPRSLSISRVSAHPWLMGLGAVVFTVGIALAVAHGSGVAGFVTFIAVLSFVLFVGSTTPARLDVAHVSARGESLPTHQVAVEASSGEIVFSAGPQRQIEVHIGLPREQLDYIATLLNETIEELRTTGHIDTKTIK